MAYIEPTPADLKARYAAFAAVEDATIAYWLTDAHRFVDQSWPIFDDYGPALIAAAAHNMARANVTGIAGGDVSGFAAAGVTSFKSGTFSAQFSETAVGKAVDGGWGSTIYGDEYLALLRRNKGGPRVTGPGVATCCGGYRDSPLGSC